MEVDRVKIYDLDESIVASGLPMMSEYNCERFEQDTRNLYYEEGEKHVERAFKLAANPPGTGHNNFLSGILVSANVTATVKWWEQFQRYHFKQIISSMSTMHRLREMLQNNTIRFNEKTNQGIVDAFKKLLDDQSITDEELAYSCPMGLELTARISTNYLQLKTIYRQRENHKLEEWRDFCEWIKRLPGSAELIIK